MVGIFLNSLGFIIVVVSLILINKMIQSEKDMYDEIKLFYNNIQDYSVAVENKIRDFEILAEHNMVKSKTQDEKIDTANKNNRENLKVKNNIEDFFTDNDKKVNDFNEDLCEDIKILKKMGLTTEEIAKKLNKGVREIEIITKLWANIKS